MVNTGKNGGLLAPELIDQCKIKQILTLYIEFGSEISKMGQSECVRRKRKATSIFSPGKFHKQRSLVAFRSEGRKELDTTEQLSMHIHIELGNETCKMGESELMDTNT